MAAVAMGAAYVCWTGSAAVAGVRSPFATAGAANPCPLCLKETDLAIFDSEPSEMVVQQSFAEPASFDARPNPLASLTPPPTSAPASGIPPAALATLGAIALTARRSRRRGLPGWRLPAIPQTE